MDNINNLNLTSTQWTGEEKAPEAAAIARPPKVEKEKAPEEPLPQEVSLEEMVKSVEETAGAFSTSLSFTIDESSGRPVIIVSDRETGKTIRQIPPKEMLRLTKTMNEIAGIIFHEEA